VAVRAPAPAGTGRLGLGARAVEKKVLERFLDCGDRQRGFARIRGAEHERPEIEERDTEAPSPARQAAKEA